MNQSFNFKLANETAVVTVETDKEDYRVYFNDEYFGTLQVDDTTKWVQVEGKPIPEETIQEIGEAIEDYYE